MTGLREFIWDHRNDDPAQLSLSASKYPGVPIPYVARQLDALAKVRKKIPSWYLPGLEYPVALSLEQCSSEACARFKAALFSGATVADLSAGLGVDAFFFSAHFAQVHFVESNPDILAAAVHNLQVLGANNVDFHLKPALDFLRDADGAHFDLLYLDPARRDVQKGKVFQLQDCSPNVLEMKDLLMQRGERILVKTAPFLDINLALQQLKQVTKVWILEYEGECREVLYLMERGARLIEVPLSAVLLDKAGKPTHQFDCTFLEENTTEVQYAAPMEYLYEPAPAILKAGAFKSFAARYGLSKLHPNTQLYTSSNWVPNLPARSFKIDFSCKYDTREVAAHVPTLKANISVRNFPDSADQVRKRLRLADGGDRFLFATTEFQGKKMILGCTKL